MEKYKYRSTTFDGNSHLKYQLKASDIVKLTNGTIGFISYNNLSSDGLAIYSPAFGGCLHYLSSYNDDLTHKEKSSENIVAIYRGSDIFTILENLFEGETSEEIEKFWLTNNWDIEITHVKKMTLEDIEKELGYKFELIH